jgi:hypothetical protein
MWYLHIFDILTEFSHQNSVEQQLTFWAKVIVQKDEVTGETSGSDELKIRRRLTHC